jgi:hypothetical protein
MRCGSTLHVLAQIVGYALIAGFSLLILLVALAPRSERQG